MDKIKKDTTVMTDIISKLIKNPIGFYLMWVLSHYICVHVYV